MHFFGFESVVTVVFVAASIDSTKFEEHLHWSEFLKSKLGLQKLVGAAVMGLGPTETV